MVDQSVPTLPSRKRTLVAVTRSSVSQGRLTHASKDYRSQTSHEQDKNFEKRNQSACVGTEHNYSQ